MWEREGDRGGKTVRETVFLDQHISVWYERRKYETVKRTEKHKIHNQILNQWKKWLETLLYSILPNIKYKSKCRLFAFCQNWASEFFFFSNERWVSLTHVHTLLYRTAKVIEADRLWHPFGLAFWIIAVTSLKCLSEGFLRGSGLGRCLYWHFHTGPCRPVRFGHWALTQGGT